MGSHMWNKSMYILVQIDLSFKCLGNFMAWIYM